MSKVKSSAIDLDYRPESYFWAYDNNIKLASDIKGAERKELYERALEVGDIDLANSLISVPTLNKEQREAQGRLHPNWMGGEYLPDQDSEEVEIARITIASTTQDVTCVYAKRGASGIEYRIVDEYEGMTLVEPNCTSLLPLSVIELPLSLIELFDYFTSGWDLFDCLESNFSDNGYVRSEIHRFIVDASSSFYAEFGALVTQRIDEWVDERREEEEEA